MTTDRETTRIVRSWLEDGRTALPDYVLDAVLDQLPATPQRRSWWPARRLTDMNAFAKLAVGAAAAVVVAVVGITVLLPRDGLAPGGAGPTASPTASPSPQPMPSGGALAPGRYAWAWPGGSISLQVPEGWISGGDGVSKNSEQPDAVFLGVHLPTLAEVTHVYTDACRSDGALEPIGPTVDDLVQALDDQEATDAEISDVVLDGRSGKRVDLVAEAGLDPRDCRDPDDARLRIWADPDEMPFVYAVFGSEATFSVYAVDVEGDRIVFTAGYDRRPPESDVAELEAMIESIEFEP